MENTSEEQSFFVRRLVTNRTNAAELVKADSSEEEQLLWTKYQQELNAVLVQEGFPWEINWPTPPNDRLPPNTYEQLNT
jgi:hypothetical protein